MRAITYSNNSDVAYLNPRKSRKEKEDHEAYEMKYPADSGHTRPKASPYHGLYRAYLAAWLMIEHDRPSRWFRRDWGEN